MHICMYGRVCVCSAACMLVCMHGCMHVCRYVCTHVHVCLSVCQSVSQSVSLSVCLSACRHKFMLCVCHVLNRTCAVTRLPNKLNRCLRTFTVQFSAALLRAEAFGRSPRFSCMTTSALSGVAACGALLNCCAMQVPMPSGDIHSIVYYKYNIL